MKYYKDENGTLRAIGESTDIDGDQSFLVKTAWRLATQSEINPPKTPEQIVADKWDLVKTQWDTLTVTTGALHTFAANEEAMKLMAFKANNMGSSAVILWVEDWATFNTNIVELKEALNLAADAHQVIFNSVFGV